MKILEQTTLTVEARVLMEGRAGLFRVISVDGNRQVADLISMDGRERIVRDVPWTSVLIAPCDPLSRFRRV